MDYQNKIKEIIYNNSEYFPFEWIRSFKMRNKSLPLADEEEKSTNSYQKHQKCCEELIREHPENNNVHLWKEALEEMKILYR